MIIARDTRDKLGHHDNVDSGLTALGHKIVRTKLYVGDVALMYDMTTAIDLKQDMQEVYGNIVGQQHRRFVDECIRAKENGIRLIVLVEQAGIRSVQDVANWKNPRLTRWNRIHEGQKAGKYTGVKISEKPPIPSAQLAKAMQTIAERYGVEWMFCSKADTVKVICEVLKIE